MPQGYGQYCPLSLAVELLGERWTILVVSRLLGGCRRFNEIHRGVPRMSATLLTQRLSQLEHAGLIERQSRANGHGHEYLLTEAGRELGPVIADLAVWGQRWARDMVTDDLDPAFLAWSMHQRINTEAMPAGRTVIRFDFTGAPADCRRFWLVNTDGVVDMCLKDPGYDVDLTVYSDLRRFVEAWRGFRSLRREIADGRVRLEGRSVLKRDFPKWLQLHVLAPYPRLRNGVERTLAGGHRRADPTD
jgi:DNA-binding HxlR family transcriptional regulator